MFRLDDQFLTDIGLAELPDEQKRPFLQHIYDELQLRVGTKLSDGMSEAQLAEFESIIDKNDQVISTWLNSHSPDYRADEAFIKMQQASKLPADDVGLRDEFTATKWLEVNRPDYRDVVARTLDELKQEIIASKDTLLNQE